MIFAFGDDHTAVLMYYPHTATVTGAATAECFTVTAGKITRTVLVFGRPSFAPPRPITPPRPQRPASQAVTGRIAAQAARLDSTVAPQRHRRLPVPRRRALPASAYFPTAHRRKA